MENTVIMVLSDNGASQEGGLGFVNAMGPYNGLPESMEEKLSRIDDIGGPDTTQISRGLVDGGEYSVIAKQNTHGGGVRIL